MVGSYCSTFPRKDYTVDAATHFLFPYRKKVIAMARIVLLADNADVLTKEVLRTLKEVQSTRIFPGRQLVAWTAERHTAADLLHLHSFSAGPLWNGAQPA